MREEQRRKRRRGKVIIKLGGSLIEKGRGIIQSLRDYVEEKDKDRALTIILICNFNHFE